ncbi:hypothetical protein EYF80_056962 [Liparis tanakae]|uniref:Secreted protein n=1 Tax=Liparis tanakae TaxID=230148 RepID=A0A4Z2EWZ5_9TELE|nr:hypothetical protein EYF80_056962 [Liparis tanakae]
MLWTLWSLWSLKGRTSAPHCRTLILSTHLEKNRTLPPAGGGFTELLHLLADGSQSCSTYLLRAHGAAPPTC